MNKRRLARRLASPPIYALYALRRMGVISMLSGSCLLALVPGLLGVLWREAWYRLVLPACGENLTVDWMAAIRSEKTRVGNNVYVGVFCWVGWADIGDDVMLGGHVKILSGGRHHDFSRLDLPMRLQECRLSKTVVGDDVWIGNSVVVMADVAPGTVVGAGAVVTKTFEPLSVLAGVPARVAKRRA